MAHEYEGNMINEFEFIDPNEKYLEWIRQQPCIMCGCGQCQASHQRLLSGSKHNGMDVLPTCQSCHMYEQSKGVLTAWNERTYHAFTNKQELREYLMELCEKLYAKYKKELDL